MIARRIRVAGVVQGVGFRPFVWRLASDLGLTGWVRNDAQGVEILAEGTAESLELMDRLLRDRAPPLARIDKVAWQVADLAGCDGFVILDSLPGTVSTAIGHDTAPCADCLAELCDSTGRRWRHAFITCTHCGPRLTVTRRLPYDRPQTSMAAFALCSACADEYDDPRDRRFHAETTCCPNCGPRLVLLDAQGVETDVADPITAALESLLRGEIVAIKGLGGFHLVCDARNTAAVTRLRERKAREEKPFAVLLASLSSANEFAEPNDRERALLESPERPIVLVRKSPGFETKLPGCAPGLASVGLMLPFTPIQFLLFHEAAARPPGTAWLSQSHLLALVCTSANPGGEPLVTGSAEAVERLVGIADAFLLHDRDIAVRCDDSVMRVLNGGSQFIRRARGFVPGAIRLDRSGPSVLATGGWFKNTVTVMRGDEAFVSQHIGDLDNVATCEFHEEVVEYMLGILDVAPSVIAHDLHPDFHSTRFAVDYAQRKGLRCVAVQHHHAHIASVLAEHKMDRPVLGLALDGIGLGDDGTAWGGELLRIDGAQCQRLGHLARLMLPGGDRAAREPWRMAASALHATGRSTEIVSRFASQPAAQTVTQMLTRGINSPATSSLGRSFDAAAGLLGVKPLASFEGQAAMLLEGLAATHQEVAPEKDGYLIDSDNVLDLRPLYDVLADCDNPAYGAALFHATLAAGLADWVDVSACSQKLNLVACGGGCFLNHILTRKLTTLLEQRGLRVLLASQLPPNDGGLSLGQAWVARQLSGE